MRGRSDACISGEIAGSQTLSGGEGGIRTPDRGVSPYNGLANRRLQPLGHLSVRFNKRVLNILALCPSVHLPDYCWTLLSTSTAACKRCIAPSTAGSKL